MSKTEKDNIRDLINSGSEIVGSATGGVIGFLAGGPAGAAVGGASGVIMAKTLSKIGCEIKQRFLGKREEVRIGATISYSAEKIQKNLSLGKTLRNDDFFDTKPIGEVTQKKFRKDFYLWLKRSLMKKN